MAVDIGKDLADNYRQLKEERGCSWEQLASEQEATDPDVAAWFRAQSASDDDAPAKAPKGRRAAGAKVTAAADASDDDAPAKA